MLAGEAPQSRTLRAEHPGDGPAQIGVEQALAACFGADDPHALRLELTQRSREVRDGDERNGVRRAACRLGSRRGDAHRTVLRDDQRVRAKGIGVAQARAEIVGVGDPIENQQQRGLGKSVEHVVQRDVRIGGIDSRDDALMTGIARELCEMLVIDPMHRAARRFGSRDELARPRIAPRSGDINRSDGVRAMPQSRGDRMEADEGASVRHGGRLCTMHERREARNKSLPQRAGIACYGWLARSHNRHWGLKHRCNSPDV